MQQHPSTPTGHSTMLRVLTVVVLPLSIYLLQLLGKVAGIAALAAGVLICLKVLLDLLPTPSTPPRPVHTVPSLPAVHCHYCSCTHGPFRVHPNLDHDLPAGTLVCEPCYLTRLLTPEYMSAHYEPL